MNTVLTLSKNACNNCYKCIRICPVKAISFNDRRTKIEQSRCIACGKCFILCPQNPQSNRNNLIRTKAYLANGKTLVASVDSAYVAYFGEDYKRLAGVLKQLGFQYVEETTLGIDKVYEEYRKSIFSKEQKYFITTTCSTMNLWVQKYYSELNPYMLQVVPPMIAHGKMLKEKYGYQCKVVYFSPCIGAKAEFIEFVKEGAVDAVFTFYDLEKWINKEEIDLASAEERSFEDEGTRQAKLFPTEGIFALRELAGLDGRDFIRVEGAGQCKEVLECMKQGSLEPAIVELCFCNNGCITGSSFSRSKGNLFKRKKQVCRYSETAAERVIKEAEGFPFDFSRSFSDRKPEHKIPERDVLESILKEMGKMKRSDELNCGTCGYQTCRQKAEAIYNEMAQTYMCLPFMRNKSETISNLIFEHSPNFIFLVGRDLKIKSINPAAIHHLQVEKSEGDDLHLVSIIDFSNFVEVFETKKNIYGKKIRLEDKNLTVILNLLYIEKQDVILAILNDITKEEEKEKELLRMKKNTVEAAEHVIAKQMRVAQEIASLLGETTAETKVILTRLMELTLNQSGD
ncbi:[Fe-Fe] hydrogenase large subunit C-terminal domain-containing protein [Geosporobacter ferrireducens]|uniref:[Fe-Fe] hydrogenase large subunit C-terminal domain-containing protein n=1 Tax=Geosporobacter ferrireducens TaxID=1424294 RepID=UPI00139D3F14|nr:[Fe-Fe] hydrogenase large subunit C-terminal domain-containing protein [Geosporobacter ferrireducens]MTI56887.1 hypothetical protein [Geosporobacter ferrireducens]